MNTKSPGTAGSMPVDGCSCGIRPSKEALEVGYEIDFSAAQTLHNQQIEDEAKKHNRSSKINTEAVEKSPSN